jgi:hypothetical protein
LPRPRKVDTGAPFEVGRWVRHRPTGYAGAVTRYESPSSRRVDWRQAPPGDDVPAVPDACQDTAHLEPAEGGLTVPAFVPPAVRQLIDRFELVDSDQPNPTPQPGERAIHRQATRLWTGGALGCDDGHDCIVVVAELVGWKPNPNYGDWPLVVEWLNVHDPKDDPDSSGRFFRYYRLTYLDRAVYLAEYAHDQTARSDAMGSAPSWRTASPPAHEGTRRWR